MAGVPKTLAVMVTRGSTNHFVQVLTLLMAAVHSDMAVRVLFRDESLARLTPDGIRQFEFSEAFRPLAASYVDRLKQHDLADLRALLAQIKASGDVKLYVCSSSLALSGLSRDGLIAEIDEVRGLTAFLLEDIASADQVFTL